LLVTQRRAFVDLPLRPLAPTQTPKEAFALRSGKASKQSTKSPGKQQFVLKAPEHSVPLAINVLLLSNFTTGEAKAHTGVCGKFELMYRTWTTVARGSPHPPWDVLLAKVPTALSCLPDAETKTVKHFRRMWEFVLDRFADVEGTTKDKFLAADKDIELQLQGGVKAVFEKFCVKEKPAKGDAE